MLQFNMVINNNIEFYRSRMRNTLLTIVNQYQCSHPRGWKSEWTACTQLYEYMDWNIQWDLATLRGLNVSTDDFGFMPLRRNVRNSIECFYDIFNISADPVYITLVKYFMFKDYHENPDVRKALRKEKYGKYLKYKFLTIANKSEIAKSHTLDSSIADELDNLVNNSNNIVHPNFFLARIADFQKNDLLKYLLETECKLLKWGFLNISNDLGYGTNPPVYGTPLENFYQQLISVNSQVGYLLEC